MANYRPIDDAIDVISTGSIAAADAVLAEWRALQAALKPGRVESLLEGERWRAAIETGLVEHLYSFGQGMTENIVQYGLAAEQARVLDASVRGLIEGHKNAYDVLLDRIRSKQPVTPHFIRELHASATGGQECYEARDGFGDVLFRQLSHGSYKSQDNHVLLPGGGIQFYAPHYLVEQEVQRLTDMPRDHQELHPVVLAAFAHHRLTQIHPFEDGNGRVARLLADYYLASSGYLPLIVTRSLRDSYLRSLHEADAGRLGALVDFVIEVQRGEVSRVERRAFDPESSTSVPALEIAEALASAIASRKKSPRSERSVKEEILTPMLLDAESEISRRLDVLARPFLERGIDFSWRFDKLIWEQVTPDQEVQTRGFGHPSVPVRQILGGEGLKCLTGVEAGYLRYFIRAESVNREYRLRAIMALTRTGHEKVALLSRGTGVDDHRPKIVDVAEMPIRWDPWLDESLGRLVLSLTQR